MKISISWYSKFPTVPLAFLLAFCFVFVNPVPAAAGELELLVPGELSVATEGTYPPFSMVDDKGQLWFRLWMIHNLISRLKLK